MRKTQKVYILQECQHISVHKVVIVSRTVRKCQRRQQTTDRTWGRCSQSTHGCHEKSVRIINSMSVSSLGPSGLPTNFCSDARRKLHLAITESFFSHLCFISAFTCGANTLSTLDNNKIIKDSCITEILFLWKKEAQREISQGMCPRMTSEQNFTLLKDSYAWLRPKGVVLVALTELSIRPTGGCPLETSPLPIPSTAGYLSSLSLSCTP